MSGAGRCFYCRTPFQLIRQGQRLGHNHPTKDHVYPHTVPLPAGLDRWSRADNQVPCCYDCNHRKGKMHPIAWLSICPDPAGAAELAALLLKLGQPAASIDFAFERRKRLA